MQIIKAKSLTMSSLEIADMVNSRHDVVKRSIERMAERHVISLPPLAEVKVSRSRRDQVVSAYVFSGEKGKRDSIIVVAQLSPEVTAVLVDRWSELEEIVRNGLIAAQSRQSARLEAPQMSDALKVQREACGKEIKSYHFSNEFDLINRITLGQTSKQFRADHGIGKEEPIRDHLSAGQIKCIEHLQRLNTSLIEIGMPFEERKAKLNQVYILRHKRGLIAEVMRLEA